MEAVAAQEKISLNSGERRWDEISTTYCQQWFWIISCPSYHQVERRRPWLMEQCGYKTNEALRSLDMLLHKLTQTGSKCWIKIFAHIFQAWSTKNQLWSIWDWRIFSQTGDWLTKKRRLDLNTTILDEYWLPNCQTNKKVSIEWNQYNLYTYRSHFILKLYKRTRRETSCLI